MSNSVKKRGGLKRRTRRANRCGRCAWAAKKVGMTYAWWEPILGKWGLHFHVKRGEFVVVKEMKAAPAPWMLSNVRVKVE